MFTAFKLFFSSSAGWVTLALIAAFGLGAYSYGHANGYADGHTKGFTEGHDSRNEEVSHLQDNVAGLTKVINDERKAQAKKIKDVQDEASNTAVATEKRLGQQIRARDQIIASYKADVKPEIQQHCALSVETVRAINALIQTVNEESDEIPASPTPPDSGSSADPASVPDASGTTSTVKDTK